MSTFMEDTPSPPSTPLRPPRSLRRVDTSSTLASSAIESPYDDTIITPRDADTSSLPTEALVLGSTSTDSPGSPSPLNTLTRSKSRTSIKRKPVPLDPGESVPDLPLTSPTAESIHPRRSTLPTPPLYTLSVDPPPTPPSPSPSYPSYPPPSIGGSSQRDTAFTTDLRQFGVSAGVSPSLGQSSEDLPVYSEQRNTETNTLAKELWKWGWLCPLLWGVGMTILWVPLHTEDEEDPEKAQRMRELCDIVRETEVKYAKRCLYGFVGFSVLVALIITLVVVLKFVR
ncbi:hypothetical protein BD324DRAFT_647734 [Kockovaella imperatae]|uniref:Uncharacterized protein n=1 Tax=Kockovaella imperatae TaxID=4999 RepID=A0A1Y1US28_9TREE|nr:hypothetical protein BD324DRAFT_647734 [Kockovaella imperatae]ORX40828.1 hypothetical protein BD324DRAFT_647734 [Kockovaella imperatae]